MKNKFNKFTLIILLIIARFLFLLPIDYQKSNFIIAIISLIFIVLNLNCFVKNKGKFRFYVIAFIFFVICEIFISKLKYDQNIIDIMKASLAYFSILLYYIITFYLTDERINFIKKCIVNITILMEIILISQYFLFNTIRFKFIALDLSKAYRMDGVRLAEGAYFISIGVIIALGKLINDKKISKKEKKLQILAVLLGLFYIIFVAKTRAFLLVWGLSLGSMLILGSNNVMKKMKMVLILIITMMIIMKLPIMKKYKELSTTDTYSTNVRIEAVNYYYYESIKTPLFGMGIIYEKNPNDTMSYILHGVYGKYFRSDVGIFGLMSEFGIVGLVWYFFVLLKMFKNIRIKIKYNIIENRAEIIGLFIFMISTSATLLLVSPDLISYFTIILILFQEGKKE